MAAMRHHGSAPFGFHWAALAAGLLAVSSVQAAEQQPFSFRPDLPQKSSPRPNPAAQQRAHAYDSALRNEIRRLDQRREPLSSSSAYRFNKARSELQRLRNGRR